MDEKSKTARAHKSGARCFRRFDRLHRHLLQESLANSGSHVTMQ